MDKVGKSEQSVCAYCGTNSSSLTKEDVIPKVLFDGKAPPNKIIVPACVGCNNKKSDKDAYFAYQLVVDARSSQHPVAQKIIAGRLKRATQREIKPTVIFDASTRGRWVSLRSKWGKDLAPHREIPLDKEAIDEYLKIMVQGLYFHRFYQRFPENCSITVNWNVNVPVTLELLRKSGAVKPKILGDNVFSYTLLYGDDGPKTTFWYLCFYNSRVFTVSTEPAVNDGEQI